MFKIDCLGHILDILFKGVLSEGGNIFLEE